MMNNFNSVLKTQAQKTEAALDKFLPEKDGYQKKIYEAMRYSLLGGGKRVRGVLALECCRIACGDETPALPFAAAVEMVHAYSLIHDDLPAMDNDDLRRGKPTNHKVFGEAMAILAGDGLLGCAFETVLFNAENKENAWQALKIMAKGLGPEGMLGGQVIDMGAEGRQIDEDELFALHSKKTGALIKTACVGGGVMGGGDSKLIEKLEKYADCIGLAFQIKDDILDVEGDAAVLGKNTGMDKNRDKTTFVTLFGLEKSKQKMRDLTLKATEIADDIGSEFLADMAKYLLDREN